ncbi:hypothetical protein D9M71_261710 [compost metagenome]
MQGRRHQLVGQALFQLQGPQQALSAHFALAIAAGQAAQAFAQVAAVVLHLGEEARLQHGIQHGQAGGTHQRIAVVAAFQFARLSAARRTPGQQSGQRHATAKALAQSDDVGAHAIGFFGQQRATAANAGLYLIEDQQDAQFTAERFHTLEVFLRGRDNTRLALDRLEHDRHGARIHLGVQRRQVIERHLAEARQARLAAVARQRVGRRQRAQAAAMAGLAGGDDVVGAVAVQLAPFARQLDRAFAGLGTAVEQVGLVASGTLAQAVDQPQQATAVEARARVDQRLGLVAQRFYQHAGAMAQAVHRATLGEVQIGMPFVVPQPRALATHEHLRCAFGAGHQAFTRQRRHFRQDHRRTLGLGDGSRGRAAQVEQVHQGSNQSR